MRISINLATKQFTDYGPIIRQLRIAMGVLVVLSLGFWLGLHLFHTAAEKARARAHSLDGEFAKITAERQGYEALMREPENARVLNQSQMLNRIFEEKAFSWTLAMEDLETVLPGGVQVTTLEPQRDEKTGVITVKLRVLGPRDKSIDLVRNLEHSKRFVNARIVDESLDTGNSTTQQIEPVLASNKANFNMVADYSLPSEEESKAIIKKQKKADAAPAATVQRGPYQTAAPVRPTGQVQQPQAIAPVAPQPNANQGPRPRHFMPENYPHLPGHGDPNNPNNNDENQQIRPHPRSLLPHQPNPSNPSNPTNNPGGAE